MDAEHDEVLGEFRGVFGKAPRHIGDLRDVDMAFHASARGKGASRDIIQVFDGFAFIAEVSLPVNLARGVRFEKVDERHRGIEGAPERLNRRQG